MDALGLAVSLVTAESIDSRLDLSLSVHVLLPGASHPPRLARTHARCFCSYQTKRLSCWYSSLHGSVYSAETLLYFHQVNCYSELYGAAPGVELLNFNQKI